MAEGKKELEIHYREDPLLYVLRDECNRIAAASGYRNELEQEFCNKKSASHMKETMYDRQVKSDFRQLASV